MKTKESIQQLHKQTEGQWCPHMLHDTLMMSKGCNPLTSTDVCVVGFFFFFFHLKKEVISHTLGGLLVFSLTKKVKYFLSINNKWNNHKILKAEYV